MGGAGKDGWRQATPSPATPIPSPSASVVLPTAARLPLFLPSTRRPHRPHYRLVLQGIGSSVVDILQAVLMGSRFDPPSPALGWRKDYARAASSLTLSRSQSGHLRRGASRRYTGSAGTTLGASGRVTQSASQRKASFFPLNRSSMFRSYMGVWAPNAFAFHKTIVPPETSSKSGSDTPTSGGMH